MSYDRALTVFSPDGHLFQVEYAMEAVSKGSTVVGVCGPECVVLAVEKKSVPKLQDPRTVRKIYQLDSHILLAFSGLSADARVLIDRARVECQSHRLTIEDAPTPSHISRHLAHIQQRYTQRGGVRPFGVCTLVVGLESNINGYAVPVIFLTEPSGISSQWRACAIGRGSKSVREFLERTLPNPASSETLVSTEATCKVAIAALLEVVQSGATSMEIAIMERQSGNIIYLSTSEIQAHIETIEAERAAEAERRRLGQA